MSPRRTLAIFGAALGVVLAGVGWISATALRLDRAELEARRRAALEENVRLALWRLDTALLPLVARENARPAAEYRALPPGERPEHTRLLFRVDRDGAIGTPERGEHVAARLGELRGKLGAAELLAALPAAPPQNPANPRLATYPAGTTAQAQKSLNEWQMRSASLDNANVYSKRAPMRMGKPAEELAALTPVWVGGELLLARRTGRDEAQGVWLDWAGLERWLPTTVADLLPAARVEPLGADPDMQRRLAALPLRLVPGPVDVKLDERRASVGLVLAVAWAGLLLAACAVVALMAGTLSLSERRATFVSAVTHELRTPLTTLQAYSEMLVDGKIKDPDKQRRYLETLHREALRLAHLVENVLAYAGVERGRRGRAIERLEVAALFDRVAERLAGRAAGAGMTLEVAPPPPGLALAGDAGALEQILFNLVDNACKYAASATDRRILVDAAAGDAKVALRVRDHGPGIPPDVRRRLFSPFSKSAAEAAATAPGVGLGLALSRRLARAMRGDLALDPAAPGACFVLTLPAA